MRLVVIIALAVIAGWVLLLWGCLAAAEKSDTEAERRFIASGTEDEGWCAHCNRWSECNGADKETCPLWQKEGEEDERRSDQR